MKFLCGSCRTKYQISDDKVRGKILTIRCKKCGSKILVRESLTRDAVAGTAVAPVTDEDRAEEVVEHAAGGRLGGSAALSSAFEVALKTGGADDLPTSIAPRPSDLEMAGAEWYVAMDGEQQGPFAFAEVVRRVAVREILPKHHVWHDGMGSWSRVRDVPDLAAHVPGGSKKKGPPPLPLSAGAGAGAEVVDFAAKRAERQRGSAEADRPAADPSAAEALKGPAATVEPGSSTTPALHAGTGGAALRRGTEGGNAEPRALEDLLSLGSADDIFANVPRASEADLVQRESTRFFVAAAGVQKQRQRNKLGIAMGAAAGLLVLALLGALFTGAIKIPGIGNPFASVGGGASDELAAVEGDPEDPSRYKGLLGAKERRPKGRRPAANGGAGARAGAPGEEASESAAASAEPGGSGPRGGEVAASPLEIGELPSAHLGQDKLSAGALPESNVEDMPPLDGVSFDPNAVTRVVSARKRLVSICYDQSLKARESLRGKMEFVVTIEPNGGVSAVRVDTAAFKGTKLARCIEDKIRDWRFPSFQGSAQEVRVPFVLEKGS
jgi:predicted Zn finger-like uncharacterized protein